MNAAAHGLDPGAGLLRSPKGPAMRTVEYSRRTAPDPLCSRIEMFISTSFRKKGREIEP
jgi:hypothetical protein